MLLPRNVILTAVLALVALGAGVWVNGRIASGEVSQVTFSVTIDETAPASLTEPVDDDCPVGEPCKSLAEIEIADDGAPVPSTTTIIPVALQGATGTTIPNGRTTGQLHARLHYVLSGTCSSSSPVIEDTQSFFDGAIKDEGPDDGTVAALNDLTVWPTLLEADLRVAELLSTGHTIQRRYVATLIGPFSVEIPVNVLFFDVSDGNGFGGLTLAGTYGVGVIGDPSAPLPIPTCTEMVTDILLLGQTAEGEVISTCEAPGPHTVNSALTREVSGSIVFDALVSDTVTCSGGAPPTPTPTDTPEPTATPIVTGTPPTATPTATITPTATPTPPKSILIYGPSLHRGTPNRPDNEETLATAAGYNVTVADADTWSAMTTGQFAAYDAIIFGDPVLGVDISMLATAESTKATWSAAISGQVIVIGSDPITHQLKLGGDANELTLNAIGFAASGPGVGLYASLSTYYRLAEPNTAVAFLSDLGEFEVLGQAAPPLSDPPLNGCPDDVTIVQPAHPAMSGITAAGLSDWGCSIHEVFNAFPSSFSVLATNTTTGLPYIVATEPLAPTPTPTATDTPTPTPTPTPVTCPPAPNFDGDTAQGGPGIGNGTGIPGNDGTVPMSDPTCDVVDDDDDNDGIPDASDSDPRDDNTYDDNSDGDPCPPLGTDASDDGPSWDTDCNGVLDGFDATCPLAANPDGDDDSDGLLNTWEACKWGTSPSVVNTDGDTLGDCVEAADVDGDGDVTFVGDTILYAKAGLLPPGDFGKDGDFDINGDGAIDYVGDVTSAAKFGLIPGMCQ